MTHNDPTKPDVRTADSRNGRPHRITQTGPQIYISKTGLSTPELDRSYPVGWFEKVRLMRTDPTLSLMREIIFGCILQAEWAIGHTEDAPEGADEEVFHLVSDLRQHIVLHTLQGYLDFGWQVFEKVWAIDENGNAVIDVLKPLLQDVTRIIVNKNTGEYLGVVQDLSINTGSTQKSKVVVVNSSGDKDAVFGSGFLKAKDTVLCNINVEGTYWYGRPIVLSAESTYDQWNNVNKTADVYDNKVAGSHWVVYYPLGQTEVDGVKKDNFLIAKDIIKGLENSGAVGIPNIIDRTVTNLNENIGERAWEIQLLSDQTNQQATFTDRLQYLDNLKVRAMGFPERSVLQGKFGTKAEAETHADLGVAILEYRFALLTQQVSLQLVNDYMKFNYGRESVGTVFIKPGPIADDAKNFLRDLFKDLADSHPEVVFAGVNRRELHEKSGIPVMLNESEENQFNFDLRRPPAFVPPAPVEDIDGNDN